MKLKKEGYNQDSFEIPTWHEDTVESGFSEEGLRVDEETYSSSDLTGQIFEDESEVHSSFETHNIVTQDILEEEHITKPVDNEDQLARPKRNRSQPACFRDFDVKLLPSIDYMQTAPDQPSSTIYPIANYVSYDAFSDSHKAYLSFRFHILSFSNLHLLSTFFSKLSISIFMASLEDIGVSALINLIGVFAFLLAFAFLRLQPVNDRVYFPKWYINGARSSPRHRGNFVGKFVNLNFATYLTFLNWMPQAMKMTESEIIEHAGLDSAVFLRIYILGLKIFGPITIVALLILVPVNVSGGTLFFLSKELVVSNIDKLSISNIQPKSLKFFAHISMMYLFTSWICYMLYKEYDMVASMRLKFLASKSRRAEQFTVLARNVPHVSGRSVSDCVDSFFKKNHPDHYLSHQVVYNANKFGRLVRRRHRLQNWLDYNQLKYERHPEKRPTIKTGFLGLWGKKVDSVEYYKQQIKEFDERLTTERQKVLKDPKCIMPAAFVSFNTRWGAAVCAQTHQSKNPTLWLTKWAPEPRDVYWKNLAIPLVSLSIRKLVISLLLFALVFFYLIPIAFVQSLANLEGLERVAPFLKPVVELSFVKSFLQGFLPVLERRTAAKYYYFMLVNVFLGSIVAGTAFEQLDSFLHQSPTEIPRTIGVSIPMKATFFITYIMVDGWAGIAAEILRLKPLVIYHLKNMFIVKTERDREKAMDPGSVDFPETIPSLQLYFLMGIVYAVITPILLPFILVFFAFAYFVYRHQLLTGQI
ncbi:unnamed protein product [Lactuca saligna]|uniref:CSC1-like protein n=1 Tax=Lactuca saligna TaxID=75948 RepID=A0AA36ECT9_LACSI|nr:unnamed protein product [Lactuca saligna]